MVDRDGYRPNVGIILINARNQVFWGKRVQQDSWQYRSMITYMRHGTTSSSARITAKMIMSIVECMFLFFIIINSTSVVAQQSLFNVPSVEITEKDKLFFQEQINLLSTGVSNTTLDYGLGNGLEMGLNLLNFDLYTLRHVWYDPMLLLNVQKGFHVTEQWKVGIGTQSGSTLPFSGNIAQFVFFNYWNNAFDLQEWGKYYLGAYHANTAYAGSGIKVNLMAGVELPVTKDVHILADYINGNNNISAGVFGFVWYATPHWQLSVGSQISAPSKSPSRIEGAVFEFTFVQ